MEVLILLMFVGIVMVALMLTFFCWTVRAGSFQHADRLALLPLGDDDARPSLPRSESLARAGTEVEEGHRGARTAGAPNGPAGPTGPTRTAGNTHPTGTSESSPVTTD